MIQIGEIIYAVLIIFAAVLACFVILSAIPLAVLNFIYLFIKPNAREESNIAAVLGMLSFLSSIILTGLLTDGYSEMWYNVTSYSKHIPVSLPHIDTFITMIIIGILGYFILAIFDVEKIPPLMFAVSVSMIYIGAGISIMWTIQTIPQSADAAELWNLLLCIYPVNYILASAGLLKRKIIEYAGSERTKHLKGKIRSGLYNSMKWPVYGFILMLPLFGLIVSVLMLFGQDYDSVVKMWTQTSDWNLSQMGEPAKNIINHIEYNHSDGHYLCTVAAGGHKRLVHPKRKGIRHDHEIIVNRQLCIANAFEQLLEEKTPKLHRIVRRFYDKYGLPVATYIRHPITADIVYIIMKPLEWIFLVLLYLCDTEPEVRIAVQYLPKKDREELIAFLSVERGWEKRAKRHLQFLCL